MLSAIVVVTDGYSADWPSWRGPGYNGAATEIGLPSSVEAVRWRVALGGRSTPVIHDGRVFAINLAGQGVTEQERVLALDLRTGELLWEHRFNVFHTDIPNARVGWASVAVDPETGNVYAHGVGGMFFCFDRDGEVLWSYSLTEVFGRISGYGGRTHTPIVDQGRVIISFLNSSFGSQGIGLHRYLAMDKRTGEVLWWSTPGGKPLDTTYSVPVVTVVDGVRLLIAGNADGGVYAMKIATGEPVWGFQLSQRGINASIVVQGHRVYASHSEENHDSTAMGRVVCIDARGSGDVTKTHEMWRADGIAAGYASPALLGDRLYVMNNFGVLYCLDAESGSEHWQQTLGRVGKGSPVCADGKIYVATVNSGFAILEDLGEEARLLELSPFESETGGVVEAFGSPAVSDGCVVFFTSDEMVCLADEDAGEHQVATPAGSEAGVAATPTEAEMIQVRPGEVLLEPGEEIDFRAIAFDDSAHSVSLVDAVWSYDGSGGSIDSEGRFNATAEGGSVGTITAKHGAFDAAARVRIVPPLPLAEDFDSYAPGEMLSWWIGVSKAKYAVETLDGSSVLKKLADDRGPIFNRSRVYITRPLETGYTVQADVRGDKVGRRRGDVGLINARYRLELYGAVNRVRVVSWVPGPRYESRGEFAWEPDRWYTVKFRVDLEGDEAHTRVKVWPRDEAEPGDWTLEGVDPQPNREGSAGIYAYSMAPVYFDNVRVYREE